MLSADDGSRLPANVKNPGLASTDDRQPSTVDHQPEPAFEAPRNRPEPVQSQPAPARRDLL
jgi:hypothetical protein